MFYNNKRENTLPTKKPEDGKNFQKINPLGPIILTRSTLSKAKAKQTKQQFIIGFCMIKQFLFLKACAKN